MIYLAKHKLLFLKPRKTAGTSVELALSCNSNDENDIITPIAPRGVKDELIRFEIGGHLPKNWARLPFSEKMFLKRFHNYRTNRQLPKGIFGLKSGYLYQRLEAKDFNHMTPDRLAKAGGRDILENSFYVTISRHPYEATVSAAWHRNSQSGKSFEEDLEKTIASKSFNSHFLFSNRKPDFVLRYEDLNGGLTELEKRFSISLIDKLPMTKRGFRKDRQPAKDVLSDTQKSEIKRKNEMFFSELGYQE